MRVRSRGARLAVPLLVMVTAAATLAGAASLAGRAAAAEGCAYSIDGIDCWYGGTTTSTAVVSLPPYRYLATRVDPVIGACWYWSRYPPGIDSNDIDNDAAIILTQFRYPECPSSGGTVVVVSSRAWEVFRSFPLRAPDPRVVPTVGITNLESIVTAPRPGRLRHVETLPDGRVLEVEAYVTAMVVSWGDGWRISYPAGEAFADGARHRYALKTCPVSYRSEHPLGRNCHPTLERYPVTVSFSWLGRYRTGGAWTVLGTLSRWVSFSYDVDEVVGYLVP